MGKPSDQALSRGPASWRSRRRDEPAGFFGFLHNLEVGPLMIVFPPEGRTVARLLSLFKLPYI